MNLPVDRVDVHMDTHMFIVCFWKGRRRADRRARHGQIKVLCSQNFLLQRKTCLFQVPQACEGGAES